MQFDGRSWLKVKIHLTSRDRLLIFIATRIMPIVSVFIISDFLFTCIWKFLGVEIGENSLIRRGTHIINPRNLKIGKNCLIHAHFKNREMVILEDSVELVQNVLVTTQSHNFESPFFESVYKPVLLKSFTWLGPNSIVLQGTTMETGSALAAGAVLTKNTSSWSLYGGIPAKILKTREMLKVPNE